MNGECMGTSEKAWLLSMLRDDHFGLKRPKWLEPILNS